MLTIAWDVDDVLNECMDIWFENWRRKHPHLNLKYEDLTDEGLKVVKQCKYRRHHPINNNAQMNIFLRYF